MKRKHFIAGIALIGCVLFLASTSWAGQGRDGYRYQVGGAYRQGWQSPPCNGRGWQNGRGNPPQPACRAHAPGHQRRHHQKRPVVVEKHVYHHYPVRDCRVEGRYSVAAALIDQAFGIYIEARGAR